MNKNFLLTFALIACSLANAQSTYQLGTLSALTMNKGFNHGYKVNFKLESRQLLKEGYFNAHNAFDHEYTLTDLTTILAKKITTHKSLALGYLFRIREGKVYHRSIQQFSSTLSYARLKMSHRFMMDQTFRDSFKTIYRLRYRIAAEIPFRGDQVDPKEVYLKVNHEYVNALQDQVYDLEIRGCSFLGYAFTTQRKLELGLDYRINSFINDSSFHRFFIGINWYEAF